MHSLSQVPTDNTFACDEDVVCKTQFALHMLKINKNRQNKIAKKYDKKKKKKWNESGHEGCSIEEIEAVPCIDLLKYILLRRINTYSTSSLLFFSLCDGRGIWKVLSFCRGRLDGQRFALIVSCVFEGVWIQPPSNSDHLKKRKKCEFKIPPWVFYFRF